MLTGIPAGVDDAYAEGRAVVFLVITGAFDCGHFEDFGVCEWESIGGGGDVICSFFG